LAERPRSFTCSTFLELCRDRGLRTACPGFDEVFRAAVDAGHGPDDFAMLARFLR
jgi:hypothetical protein